jgi:hypothetical protein
MGLRPTYEDKKCLVSNPSPRTHHPFLFVIPSVAEGSAVRLSQSRKPRVAALPRREVHMRKLRQVRQVQPRVDGGVTRRRKRACTAPSSLMPA